MKHFRSILATAAVAFCVAWQAHAAEIKIIANPSVTAGSVSAGDIKDVFLLDKDSLAGGHVEPVVSKGGPAHDAFLKEYVGKTDGALQALYRSLVFTGKASMPKALASDAEVVAYVAKTKGAIGYVSGDASSAGVKVLTVK
jgi:hypothetical protein